MDTIQKGMNKMKSVNPILQQNLALHAFFG